MAQKPHSYAPSNSTATFQSFQTFRTERFHGLSLFFIEGLRERFDGSGGQIGAAAPAPGGVTLEFFEAAVTFLEVRGAFDEQAACKTHNAGDQ